MFRTTCRRLARQASSAAGKKEPLTIYNNPHRAHKVWPPDFTQLTPQQQLRFEKKHKRRVALASYSPRWDKGVRLVRFFSILIVLLVMIFGAEYRFWGSDYVYKPTEEIIPRLGRLFGILEKDNKFKEQPEVPRKDPERKQ